MSHIARFDGPGAAERTVRCAERFEAAGFQDVQTHYLPPTDEHTVTGTLPPDTVRRAADELLGR